MSTYFITEPDLAASDQNPVSVRVCRPDGWIDMQSHLSEAQCTFATEHKFSGDAGQCLRLPDADGRVTQVLFGAGPSQGDVIGAIRLGELSASLSEGLYRLATWPEDWSPRLAAIGWGIGAYKFDRYLPMAHVPPCLVLDTHQNPDETIALVDAIVLGRDLINMPAGDMGPIALQDAAMDLAADYDQTGKAVIGEDLLAQNFPMIHAVGRAAHEAPRLVHFEWGDPDHPRLALIGKGITFDTGGVNMKSASGSRLMKKDMGGAAHALALAKMIMANDLPVRLHVVVAIAENAVSAGAYRPGDILTSRAGLTVEVDNTDAEGRLVLGDALTFAAEFEPTLMIDFATLTGAARVALGPTLPPFFSNRDTPVADVVARAKTSFDPVWHMPLWHPYLSMLNSPIADMKNSGGGFAGAVTAALFLERFVAKRPWMHFDVYGWNPTSLPAHPKGGDMFALRALYQWIKAGGLNSDFSA